VATLHDVLVTWYRDPDRADDFYPALLSADGRGLDLREIRFRSRHGLTLRQSDPPVRLERATWIAERVYDNHSHWLTAHLPKLLLLRERGELGDVLLPPERTAAMDGSLRMLGLDPGGFPTFDSSRPLLVGELTIVGTDRFRPELLRKVQKAYADPAVEPHRRVYVSRARASRRRLANEDEVWPLFERHAFERVFMEDLPFEEQVRLMQETAVLAAPHGAGLTNMIFCTEGTRIVEIADLGFPNPNFYAVAAALGLPYWIVEADSIGEGHPLDKDLRVDPEAIEAVLPDILNGL
jgi:capsular polysaccharide biosynthesis protein